MNTKLVHDFKSLKHNQLYLRYTCRVNIHQLQRLKD